MDVDQPADLSMKKERKPPSESNNSGEQTSHSVTSSSPSASSMPSNNNNNNNNNISNSNNNSSNNNNNNNHPWVAEMESSVASGGILDLASRGPTRRIRSNGDRKMEHSDSDIIVLSDEESLFKNGHTNGFSGSDNVGSMSDDGGDFERPPLTELKELSVEELNSRGRAIRKLQEDLRYEEMKLVLLKKLQQSHQFKENMVIPPQAGKLVATAARNGSMNPAPPPLMRGNQMPISKSMSLLSHHSSPSSHMMMPPLVRPHGMSHCPPPPLVMAPRSSGNSTTLPANVLLQQNMIRGPSNLMNRNPVTTPPNVVMGYPIQSQAQGQSGTSSSSSPSVQQNQLPSQPPQHVERERVDSQTPAQRQAAAKLALRKQLEKTLLQIPPPKPPPPEMHFIPNPNNSEFINLVGLEAVVNLIIENGPVKEDPPKPFECIQCGTDFTPVWKWSNPCKGTVTCEQCVTSNIKKALKAEHTNRLKTAFVKALQQEQEIEQRMSQVSSSPPPPVPQHQPLVNSLPPHSSSNNVMVSSSTTSSSESRLQQQMSKHAEPPMRQSHSAAVAAANLTAAHQHMMRLSQQQPLPAHMLTSLNPFLAQAYQYQLLGKSPMSSAELQRQYLLDMIPPHSMPQGIMNWKT